MPRVSCARMAPEGPRAAPVARWGPLSLPSGRSLPPLGAMEAPTGPCGPSLVGWSGRGLEAPWRAA